MISFGVVYSFPGQNGQNPPFFLWEGEIKSVGRFPLSTEMITQRPEMGSFLSSDTYLHGELFAQLFTLCYFGFIIS